MIPATAHRAAACLAICASLAARPAGAQHWRTEARTLGTTARVLIVGAHPDDEDNALIAWLSLGRHVETAYLSLTRGESGVNVAGKEQQSALGNVRTAELLAERARDGAHQYFTRAYDFGPASSDSALQAAWPHDSLLADVVAIVRAFRPQVIVSLYALDTTEHDLAHRDAARLAAEAYAAAGDGVYGAASAHVLPAWRVSRLLTAVPAVGAESARVVALDVGELDRATNRNFAEIGAEIRHLQRTQPPAAAPPVGPLVRLLRVDSTCATSDGWTHDLFAGVDTSWARFGDAAYDSARDTTHALDSLRAAVGGAHDVALTAPPDSVAIALARVVQWSAAARAVLSCSGTPLVVSCAGERGDLAETVSRIEARASRALRDAAGITLTATVARALVAAHESVPLTVTLYDGGGLPLTVSRVAATEGGAGTLVAGDSSILAPGATHTWSANLLVPNPEHPWWQLNGLQAGTWCYALYAPTHWPAAVQTIVGEDRIPSSSVSATVSIAGRAATITASPIVQRAPTDPRDDVRHPVTGVRTLSLLLARTAEYERANLPILRFVRVYVSSSQTVPETATVTLRLPHGLHTDSAARTVVLPPLGDRTLFFALTGKLAPGTDTISADADIVHRPPPGIPGPMTTEVFKYGFFSFDYPHIPTQRYLRQAADRVEALDLRLPASLHVAYLNGHDDLQPVFDQLGVRAQAIDAALLPVVDLTGFSTIVVGAGAAVDDALLPATQAITQFLRRGGTLLFLPGGEEIARSGLLPFPIVFDSMAGRVSDPGSAVRTTNPRARVLTWPNVISGDDFSGWVIERARGLPLGVDARYITPLVIGDAGHADTPASLLLAPLGKGMVVYSALSLDRQLDATIPGAARLFVNLLCAGMRPAAPRGK
jgi:LmbE family N-acetylglucosaminyl deacetylase